MAKFILQSVMAVAVWFGTSRLELPLVARLLALVGGAVLVHQVWSRRFPEGHLGVRAIDDDDPLMQAAIAEARRTLPVLRKLYREHPRDTMIKYPFATDSGTVENLWGDLVELSETTAKIFLRTPPLRQKGRFERGMIVPLEKVLDWQIEFSDGSLRGGFTSRAMFKVYEREEGHAHPEMQAQLARFRSIDE